MLIQQPNDVDGFMLAIKQLITNPEATKAMAFQARKKVEGFDWGLVKLQWMALLS